MTGELILDRLARHVRERPNAPAVVALDGEGGASELSWAELGARVERLAAALQALGVQAGEPVAFQLPNGVEFVVAALATLRVGGICAPLMPIFRERELELMLRQSAARVLFVPERFRGHDHEAMATSLSACLPELEHVLVLGRDPLPGRGTPAKAAVYPPEHLAQLLFTSGTSGEPKGVLHSHGVLMQAAWAHIRHFGLDASDVIYVPSPLAHQTGFLYGMWIALVLGAPQVLQPIWNPTIGLEAMRRFGVSFVQAATPFLADLVACARERRARPEALRTFVATGAAIPRELARTAREVLGGEVGGAWGTTETCLGSAFAPGEPAELAWSTDGRALAGVELRVVDEHGRPLPPGEEGSFEVRTDCLFRGYLNRPEETAAALTADGFYRTGDLARIDQRGYVRITGRIKDIVNRGGEKIPVAEIEELIYRHPAVREVAIVAMPDERLGERACAFVVAEPDAELDLAALREHLDAHRVTKTYWPEHLELVAALPRTASGKVQKYLLREHARALARERSKEGAAR